MGNKYAFPKVIKSIAGCNVVRFDRSVNWKIFELLREAVIKAGEEAKREGIKAPRPNEAGDRIEPFVIKALREKGFQADIPRTKRGKRKKAGYPNLELSYGDWFGYLECKTFASGQEGSSFRAFYLSPSEDPKVTRDAPHLLISFELEQRAGKYYPRSWRIYDLHDLQVVLKYEYNASSRDIYQNKSLILEEGLLQSLSQNYFPS